MFTSHRFRIGRTRDKRGRVKGKERSMHEKGGGKREGNDVFLVIVKIKDRGSKRGQENREEKNTDGKWGTCDWTASSEGDSYKDGSKKVCKKNSI